MKEMLQSGGSCREKREHACSVETLFTEEECSCQPGSYIVTADTSRDPGNSCSRRARKRSRKSLAKPSHLCRSSLPAALLAIQMPRSTSVRQTPGTTRSGMIYTTMTTLLFVDWL